jgi:hypothetical protein
MAATKEAKKAYRLREKARAGKDMTKDEARWLLAYEKNTKGGRPSVPLTEIAVRPDPVPPTVVEVIEQPPTVEDEHPDLSGIGRENDPPDTMDKINEVLDAGHTVKDNLSPHIRLVPPPIDVNAKPHSPPTGEKKADPLETEEEKALKAAIADLPNVISDMYCAWLLATGEKLQEAGITPVPPVIVEKMVRPGCKRIVEKYMPDVDQETVDLAATAGCGLWTWVQARKLKQPKKTVLQSVPVQTVETPTPSTPPPAERNIPSTKKDGIDVPLS